RKIVQLSIATLQFARMYSCDACAFARFISMLTTLAVLATLCSATADNLWIPGDNAWGSHGLWRVDAAHGPIKGTITLAGSSELSYATGLVAAGDSEMHSL